MHASPEWKDVLVKNGWEDQFQTGEPFAKFLATEQTRVSAILKEIGLT